MRVGRRREGTEQRAGPGQGGRGNRQPGSPECLGEVAAGATSSPRQAEATREKEQAGYD